jgi:membrane protein EpsK
VAGAIALMMKNLIFIPLYNAYILHRRITAFLWEIFPIILVTLTTTGVCLLVSHLWDVSGWLRLIAAGAAISVVYALIAYWILLSREERDLAWKMMPGFLCRQEEDSLRL